MTRQRLVWADSLKGWLMLLVIVGHAIQGVLDDGCNNNHVWNLIYSFHMSAFMAVSGYLSYRSARQSINGGGTDGVLWRRTQQLIIPYFAWSFIQYARNGNYSVDYLLKMVFQPDTYFWFLWVLFFISVLFHVAQYAACRLGVDELCIIFPACFVLMVIMVGFEFRMFGFQFIAYYLLFYTLGYVKRRFPVKLFSVPIVMVGLFIAWIALAWGWNMHALPAWMPTIPGVPVSLLQYTYRGVTAAVAIVVMLSMAPKILNGDGRINHFASRFGQVSLGIYMVHLTIMGYIIDGVYGIFPSVSVTTIVCLVSVLVFALSWGVVELLSRNKYTAQILLGKI